MTAAPLPQDPLGRVAALLRARQVSCPGSLDDLADAVLHAAHQTPSTPPPATPDAELTWRRERAAVLLDRDTLVCALQDLLAAVTGHQQRRSATTAAALEVAGINAAEVLVAPGDLHAAA